MFYFVRGKAAVIEPSLVVIDAGGVGYSINTSLHSSSGVKRGEEVTFYTYLHVREDIFELYGFATQSELSCFKQLIGVSGVGPKAALAILGTVTPEKLSLCIVTGDEKALCAAPGVGKKLAQRVILELKDKINASQISDDTSGIAAASVQQSSAMDDAVSALIALGYPRAAALNALKGEENKGLQTEELIRAALKKLF
ncbi:MAG: Holliday junction branch migration protein RuvA [Clostridia bacterium]|nr:Holliday junction branch migration protein RuvA [Clostridia bacterium]